MRPRCQRDLPGNQVQVGGVGEGAGEIALPHGPTGAQNLVQRQRHCGVVGPWPRPGRDIPLTKPPLGLANREAEPRLPERVPQCQPVQGVPGAGGTLSVLGLVAFMIR